MGNTYSAYDRLTKDQLDAELNRLRADLEKPHQVFFQNMGRQTCSCSSRKDVQKRIEYIEALPQYRNSRYLTF
jgi:hypothetical protein